MWKSLVVKEFRVGSHSFFSGTGEQQMVRERTNADRGNLRRFHRESGTQFVFETG
jgi:hypothetical protein